MPAAEEIYDAQYFAKMRGGDEIYAHFLSLISDLPKGLTVLDAGCGRGELMAALCQWGAARVDGFDIAAPAVEVALERLRGEPKAHAKVGDITHVDLYPADSFDAIFLTDIVEHLPKGVLEAGLANLKVWLKPGGRLLLHTFPTLGLHKAFLAALKAAGKQEHYDRTNATHCNVQTRESMLGLLDEAGFRTEKIWLENDIRYTSNELHNLQPAPLKKAVTFVVDRIIGGEVVKKVGRRAGLEEYLEPSIYAFATK